MPKILFLDIETSPLVAYVWGLFDQSVAINQIKEDWFVLSWAAKWAHADKIFYRDQRAARALANDKDILTGIHALLDEADIVVTQNGSNFDIKRLNARFIIHGLEPPSSFKHVDTLKIARKHFGFTSNKLEFLSDKVNKVYKKSRHERFHGFELWRECLAGNQAAWREMEEYNKRDILALEELYYRLIPWAKAPNFSLYRDDGKDECTCGSTTFRKKGFALTETGRFQRYKCTACGAEYRDGINLLEKADKKKRLRGTRR